MAATERGPDGSSLQDLITTIRAAATMDDALRLLTPLTVTQLKQLAAAASVTPEEYGPYDTEMDTWDSPLSRAYQALYDTGQVRSGDPGNLVRNTRLEHLTAMCEAVGLELGGYDWRTLTWLCRWETGTVQVIIGLVSRAYAAGRNTAAERPDLLSLFGELRVQFWVCPTPGHTDRRGPHGEPVTTVEWDGDVARCTYPGCGNTSTTTTL